MTAPAEATAPTERGAVVRLVDPEQTAAEIIERRGFTFATELAAALTTARGVPR